MCSQRTGDQIPARQRMPGKGLFWPGKVSEENERVCTGSPSRNCTENSLLCFLQWRTSATGDSIMTLQTVHSGDLGVLQFLFQSAWTIMIQADGWSLSQNWDLFLWKFSPSPLILWRSLRDSFFPKVQSNGCQQVVNQFSPKYTRLGHPQKTLPILGHFHSAYASEQGSERHKLDAVPLVSQEDFI